MISVLRDIWNKPIASNDTFQTNAALLIGRVLAVVALAPNGLRKIATFAPTAAGMGGTPQNIGGRVFPEQTPLIVFPAPEAFLAASITFDLLGALLIIVGWRTRTIATLLTGYVIIAMVIFHSDIRGPEDVHHIIRNVAFVGALFLLSGVGGGHWSFDGFIARSQRSRA